MCGAEPSARRPARGAPVSPSAALECVDGAPEELLDALDPVAGGLDGARLGAGALPDRRLDPISETDRLRELAGALAADEFDPEDVGA